MTRWRSRARLPRGCVASPTRWRRCSLRRSATERTTRRPCSYCGGGGCSWHRRRVGCCSTSWASRSLSPPAAWPTRRWPDWPTGSASIVARRSRPSGHRAGQGGHCMANEAQAEHWNSAEASHWVTHQLRYDTMLVPFGDRLLAAAQVAGADRVLDVGCGCGATTLEAGRRALTGTATGLDLSTSMLEVARGRVAEERLSNVSFVAGDAQTYPLPADGFDVAISRFGVMFFDDPEAAFLNLAGALAPRGRLAFVCWQDLLSNPFITVPGLALAEHAAPPDPDPPGAPGMFALADPERIRSLVAGAGLTKVAIEPLTEEILLGGGGTLADAVEFVRHGRTGRAALAGADIATRDRAVAAVSDALEPYVTAGGVRIGAASWLVTACRP